MTYAAMTLLAALQIFTSDAAAPPVRQVFMQAAENSHPVPLCTADGAACQCPNGYAFRQRQHTVSVDAETASCEPLQNTGAKRANAAEYPSIPKPETYGK